ncbi:MAG TPA: right-handed parallel beta-helix repeat-containing protein [Candidatus Thermoplasmatota archaeon]|nr:right-handed parallel beta-helix repeat-containing protein [Candidatus Thermoplasmatota archaeon]
MRSVVTLLVFGLAATPVLASVVSSDPIVIDSRDDWIRLGFEGNGTKRDPYLVRDLRVELPIQGTATGILIKNVPDYAIVEDVLVSGGNVGIHIEKAGNVSIRNVTVARASTGVEVFGGRVSQINVLQNQLGIAGEDIVIESARIVGNRVGVDGTHVTIYNSTLDRNPQAVNLEGTATTAKSIIRYSVISNSTGRGVRSSAPLDVRNSTFENNDVGIAMRGTSNVVTVRGSNFGPHENAAILVERTDVSWTLDAKNNFWGVDRSNESAKPSPFGVGAPVSGKVAYDPIAAERYVDAMPQNASGADFSGRPNATFEDESQLQPTETDVFVAVRVLVRHPDGLLSWRVDVENDSVRGDLNGELEYNARRGFHLPLGTPSTNFSVEVVTSYGEPFTYSRLLAVPPPPPPEDNTTGLPQDGQQEESPPVHLVGIALAVASVALMKKRKKE